MLRSYIFLTIAWILIFICGVVVGVLLPINTEPPVGNDRIVEKPEPLFNHHLKKGVENLIWNS